MTARPWFRFYAPDWRADPALRMCSAGARGLWIEMLCLMHEAEPRGFLIVKGQAVNAKQLAALAGIPPKDCAAYLAELEAAEVCSRDDKGTIYSRRMVRDTEKAIKDKENGKGGGNPRLKGGVNPKDKERDKPNDNTQWIHGLMVKEGEQTSQNEASPREAAADPFDDEFWPAYPQKVAKPKAREAFERALERGTVPEIITGLARYIASKPPDRHWLNPDRFLDDDRWRDEAVPAKAEAAPASDPTVWITEDSPEWLTMATLWADEHDGHRPAARGSRHERGIGKHFPARYLTRMPREGPQEARGVPSEGARLGG